MEYKKMTSYEWYLENAKADIDMVATYMEVELTDFQVMRLVDSLDHFDWSAYNEFIEDIIKEVIEDDKQDEKVV